MRDAVESQNGSKIWKRSVSKNISLKELQSTLLLEESNMDNRLTFLLDGEKFDIGRCSTEIEREWLYDKLKSL